ncbi:MAG: STAS/SEC14 domain-containing protein [Caldilineaceae bacterium]
MAIIQLQSQISLDALVGGVEQLSTADLEWLTNQVLAVRAKRRAPSLPHKEVELLQKINQGLPAETQQRFDLLTAKRRAETLTDEEYEELLELVDEIELRDAKRVEYLAELAQLRSVSLRTLMQQLDIRPPAYT